MKRLGFLLFRDRGVARSSYHLGNSNRKFDALNRESQTTPPKLVEPAQNP